MDASILKTLIEEAIAARRSSYSPYSGFKVGAALLAQNGDTFTGCNIEISGHTATCCAERTAIFKAVSQGITSFTAIAVVGGPGDALIDSCFPCGVCRQALAEFCGEDFIVIVAESADKWRKFSLNDLLPHRFSEKKS
ncbi:MAG: cytidine deaminase [Defluviitaleaceae bacterium]|nr:cytidine deaminase [Defluviitaleaceae bacterium]